MSHRWDDQLRCLLTVGEKLQWIHRCACVQPDRLSAFLGEHPDAKADELEVAHAVCGTLGSFRFGGGPSEESLEIAKELGWPDGEAIASFLDATEKCPLENLRPALWERGTGLARRVFRFIIARRLMPRLADHQWNHDWEMVFVFSEDLCGEIFDSRFDWCIEDLDGGIIFGQGVDRILSRLSTDALPPYLAELLSWPAMHGYHGLRKRLRDWEMCRPKGSLSAPFRQLKDRGAHAIGSEFLFADPATEKLQLRPLQQTLRRFFFSLSSSEQAVILLKSGSALTDKLVAELLGVARETVTRKHGSSRAAFEKLSSKLEISAEIFEAVDWADMLEPRSWPEIPAAARKELLLRTLRSNPVLAALVESSGFLQLRLDALAKTLNEASADSFVTLRGGLANAWPETIRGLRERCESGKMPGGCLGLQAQLLYFLGGFGLWGYTLTELSFALRFISSLDNEQRWLLNHSGIEEEAKRLRGDDSKVRESLSSKAKITFARFEELWPRDLDSRMEAAQSWERVVDLVFLLISDGFEFEAVEA